MMPIRKTPKLLMMSLTSLPFGNTPSDVVAIVDVVVLMTATLNRMRRVVHRSLHRRVPVLHYKMTLLYHILVMPSTCIYYDLHSPIRIRPNSDQKVIMTACCKSLGYAAGYFGVGRKGQVNQYWSELLMILLIHSNQSFRSDGSEMNN